ncbi:MAG: phosphatidate cytidylyltransferase [Alphaproteobacteria bacterium]|nr:phosphatidate cytidylyltransferase [Alphaproteobacteria bacterium]
MTVQLTTLQKRMVSALVLVPVVLGVISFGGWPFVALLIVFAGLSLYEWIKLSLKTTHKYIFGSLGLVLISACFVSCYVIRALEPDIALLFIVAIWVSDTGAYMIGKKFGKAKMAPKISPNKTWAGFAAAVLSPAILMMARYLGEADFSDAFGMYVGLFLVGGLVGAFAQLGDLLASFLKRKANVKDSGGLIPGHGGILDRVDSMILASPAFVLSYMLLMVILMGHGA